MVRRGDLRDRGARLGGRAGSPPHDWRAVDPEDRSCADSEPAIAAYRISGDVGEAIGATATGGFVSGFASVGGATTLSGVVGAVGRWVARLPEAAARHAGTDHQPGTDHERGTDYQRGTDDDAVTPVTSAVASDTARSTVRVA